MKLTDELTAKGLSRGKLAELLGVSRKTVTRMGEEVTDEVLKVLAEFVPKVGERNKEPKDFTDEEIAGFLKRRGGLEGETKPPKEGTSSPSWGKETDFEIAQSLGIRVWEFNQMIADWVKRNPYFPKIITKGKCEETWNKP